MSKTPSTTGSPSPSEPEREPEDPSADSEENKILDLAHKAKGGDKEALGDLIQTQLSWLRPKVSRKIEQPLRAALDTDDVVADAYQAIARQITNLEIRDARGVQNWLLKILERSLNDRRKQENAAKRDRRRQVGMFWRGPQGDESEGLRQLEQEQTSPPSRAARDEQREKIADAVMRLNEDQRRVIQLRDEQGLSWTEVQERSGAKSPGAARVLYHRAWQKVRDEFLRGDDSEGVPC